jgi:hypothetical protein
MLWQFLLFIGEVTALSGNLFTSLDAPVEEEKKALRSCVKVIFSRNVHYPPIVLQLIDQSTGGPAGCEREIAEGTR